jgi:hypothetical protein
MNVDWKHIAMLVCGGAVAACEYLSTADPGNAALWHAIAVGAGAVTIFFGAKSPAMFGKDAVK